MSRCIRRIRSTDCEKDAVTQFLGFVVSTARETHFFLENESERWFDSLVLSLRHSWCFTQRTEVCPGWSESRGRKCMEFSGFDVGPRVLSIGRYCSSILT